MSDRQENSEDTTPTRRSVSIRFQLLVTVNAVLAIGFVILLVGDYQNELRVQLREKHISLQEEAMTLLPALHVLRTQGTQAVQNHIDIICARMQEATSPGHHIAVKWDDQVLQAHAHQRASAGFLQAMEQAAQSPRWRARLGDEQLVVGMAQEDGITVYISEYVHNVHRVARRMIFRRLMGLLLMGAISAALLNLILIRIVTRPLNRLVTTVRRIGAGELGVQTSGFRTAELSFLAGEINSMSTSLADSNRARRYQMDKARRLQQQLRPRLSDSQRLSVAYRYEPADEVGGDYFDVKQLSDDRFLLCVADVTGHGVPAAMGAAMLKMLFDTASDQSADPATIITTISAGFAKTSLEGDFASMIIIAVEVAAQRMYYASAGHEPAYLLRHDGRIEMLDSTGPLLGLHGLWGWESLQKQVKPLDRVVLVTDGLAEARGSAPDFFGRKRLHQALKAECNQPLDVFCGRIISRVSRHCGQAPQADDWTLLAGELGNGREEISNF